MSQNGFLKARCGKTGRFYGMELRRVDGVWNVVNMTDLSPSEAARVSSDIPKGTYETNTNLLPCATCGSRRVGG